MSCKRTASFLLIFTIIFAAFGSSFCVNAAKDYEAYAAKLDKTVFDGKLGAIYSKESTTFRVWSPTSDNVKVKFYGSAMGSKYTRLINMKFTKKTGLWSATVHGDIKNTYYTYVFVRGGKSYETYDIYAKACAPNGKRSMVIDLSKSNPRGWGKDTHVLVDNPTDAKIWEIHIADFSSSKTSGVSEENRGKYLAFTEGGTTVNGAVGGHSTCVDYLKELGVNYVHINPFYDFGSVDETDTSDNDKNFNWGYDPINYNIPEGSYSSNVKRAVLRIKECKQMIQSLHNAGIGVIMDVVYNHTHESKDSAFNISVPNYYYRINPDGTWSNGSGCGNDTASERKMFRKYMIDSVMYWASEYHIDGFRFDLMGLHDVETMNLIRSSLDTLENGEKILMYGEPWKLDTTADSGTMLATTDNVKKLSERIAAFDDTYRDAVKGSTSGADSGFVQSGEKRANLKIGIRGQADETMGWASTASQAVTYASCHDNLTLWDKLIKSVKGESGDYSKRYGDLVSMNKLTAAITYTSQGIPFILAGEEFCRTKLGDENSYKSGFKLNQLDWSMLDVFGDVSDYYAGLIDIRECISAFRAPGAEKANSIVFSDDVPNGVITYTLDDEKFGKVFVGFNSSEEAYTAKAEGNWAIIADSEQAGMVKLGEASGSVSIKPRSAVIMVDKASFDAVGIKPTEGKVVVRYKDVDTKECFRSGVLRGEIGEQFEIAPQTSVLMNYDIKNKSGDKGTFGEKVRYCDFECKKYDGSYSAVTFRFVDDETEEDIAPSKVMTNRAGQEYKTTVIPSVDGYTLNLQKLPKNGCGTFTDKDQTVLYKFTRKSAEDQLCKVNIIYMTTDGEVKGTDTLSDIEGAPYKTSQIELDGYEFVSVSDNSSGQFVSGEQNVIYIYSPVSFMQTVVLILTIVICSGAIISLAVIYYLRRRNHLMSRMDIDE